jgi:hypothetical protein
MEEVLSSSGSGDKGTRVLRGDGKVQSVEDLLLKDRHARAEAKAGTSCCIEETTICSRVCLRIFSRRSISQRRLSWRAIRRIAV